MNWLEQYIIRKALKKNPERFIKMLIKKYLPERYLSTRPIRKTKRTQGPAII